VTLTPYYCELAALCRHRAGRRAPRHWPLLGIQALAAELGVAPQLLRNWIEGRYRPRFGDDVLGEAEFERRIFALTGLTLDQLFPEPPCRGYPSPQCVCYLSPEELDALPALCHEDALPDGVDDPWDVIGALGPRTARILYRRHVDGWTLEQIAAPEGVSKARVGQLLDEAYRRLCIMFVERRYPPFSKLGRPRRCATPEDSP
jgi:hypothetical protein